MLTQRGTLELGTERMKLRRFLVSDAEAMFRNYAADERVARYLSWVPYSNEQGVRAFLAETIGTYSRPDTYHWAMELQGEVVGSISVTAMDQKNESCEVGYCLGHGFWNCGITSEALGAVLAFLFREVNMRRIVAKHDVENPGSGRVMKKCGMTLEGRLREHYLRHDGTCSDALFYAVLRDDFDGR